MTLRLSIPNDLPPRLHTKEVLELVGVSQAKWNKMREEGKAPQPVYRGKGGWVYQTVAIYRFLGLIDAAPENNDHDPIMQGIERLGRVKRKTA